ncbi:MAG: hypothetical protein QS99_C0003G0053 [archaeon GW2011_AR4]|nr:MAG: hypothetical protein QS99_C0003G0053 [archaeon GW2011_AR4]
MASALDLSLIKGFQPIFNFLLIWVLAFAVLTKIKFFSESVGLHAFLAFVMASLSFFSPIISDFISAMTPWLMLMLGMIVFTILAFKTLGVSDDDITGVVRKNSSITWTIVILLIIIVLAAAGSVVGKKVGPYVGDTPPPEGGNPISDLRNSGAGDAGSTATSDISYNAGATIFHPKVLGMILIFLIGLSAVGLLSGKSYIPK